MNKQLIQLGCLVALALPMASKAQENVDLAMMQKIRQEGLQHSKVMDIAFNLTDKSGNRLTNSAGFSRAANYAKETLTSWGVAKAAIEPWGEFGKGWELEKMYFAVTAPYYKPLMAWPKTWTAGTKGLKKGTLLLVDAKDSAALEAYRGQLKGKIIILDQQNIYKHSFTADAKRYTDEELAAMAAAKPAAPRGAAAPTDTAAQRRLRDALRAGGMGGAARVLNLLKAMAVQEGAHAMISTSTRNHDGTIFAQGGGAYKGTDPANFLDMAVGVEDYNTLLRLAKS